MSEKNSKTNIDPTLPVAYREEKVEFFGRPFFVNPHVLIPRFETEELVRIALRKYAESPYDILIDCGTWSGVILLTALAEIKARKLTPPSASFGIDLSEAAIEVARTNAKNLHQEIQFRTGNLLDPLRSVSFPKNATVLILANLPYIKDADHIHMSEDTRHEPALALYGGPKTGFELYEQFFAQTEKFFEDKGLKSLTIIAEIGFDQGAYATTYLSNFSGKTEILHDLTSTPRFILYEIVK